MTSPSSQHPLFQQPQYTQPEDHHHQHYPAHPPPTTNDFHRVPLAPSDSPEYGRTYSGYGSGYSGAGAGGYGAYEVDKDITPRQETVAARREQQPSRVSTFLAAYRTRNQLVFLSMIVLQSCAVLAMIALIYATVNNAIGDLSFEDTFRQAPRLESVTTYLGLFILATIFELLVSLDALHAKNIMSLLVMMFFQVAMIVYAAQLPSQLQRAIAGSSADTESVHQRVRAYAIVIPSVIGAATIGMSGMLYLLYIEFGWSVFKKIGADIQLKRMYFTYQVFVCLLKYDAFFFAGFSIQFLILVTGTPTAEFVVTIVALPVILAFLLLTALFVRRESRPGVYLSFVLQVAGMAYFLFKLVRIFDPVTGDRYSAAKKTLTIFSVISLLFLVLTFVMTGLCMTNFDRGLKERIPGYHFTWSRSQRREATEKPVIDGDGTPLGRTQTRMSID